MMDEEVDIDGIMSAVVGAEPDVSGNSYDVFLSGDYAVKLPRNPGAADYQSAVGRLAVLTYNGVETAETRIIPSSDVPFPREHAVVQERLDTLDSLEEMGEYLEMAEGVISETEHAWENGIAFPDNGLRNWGMDDGKVKRIDIVDNEYRQDYEMGAVEAEEKLLESLGSLLFSLNRHVSPEEDWENFIRERTGIYDSLP